MIIALSTSMPQYVMLYSQARELGRYLKKHLAVKPFAKYYSDAMPPSCLVREDGVAGLYECEFGLFESENGRSIVLLSGDSSPHTLHYEFSHSILSFAKKIGVGEIFSIGTRWAEPPRPTDVTDVFGFASNPEAAERLRKTGLKVLRDEEAPYFANLVVGLAELHSITGYKLSVDHGEPKPHPASVKALLQALSKMLDFKVDTSELDREAERMISTGQRMREGLEHHPPPEDTGAIYG